MHHYPGVQVTYSGHKFNSNSKLHKQMSRVWALSDANICGLFLLCRESSSSDYFKDTFFLFSQTWTHLSNHPHTCTTAQSDPMVSLRLPSILTQLSNCWETIDCGAASEASWELRLRSNPCDIINKAQGLPFITAGHPHRALPRRGESVFCPRRRTKKKKKKKPEKERGERQRTNNAEKR